MTDRRRRRGQSLVEFALVIPIFLVLLMAIVDIGRAIWAQNSVAAGAREGARYAIVHGGTASNKCPVGPSSHDLVVADASCPYPSPSKQSVRDTAAAAAAASGTSLTVTVCYGVNCTGDTDTVDSTGAPATNARGVPVTVTVTSRVNLISSALLGQSGFGISSTTTMLVNY